MSQIRVRFNVLALVAMGYFALLVIFVSMAWGEMTATEAYDVVKSPFMALIGGSLAISKDLVDDGSTAVPGGSQDLLEKQKDQGDQKKSAT